MTLQKEIDIVLEQIMGRDYDTLEFEKLIRESFDTAGYFVTGNNPEEMVQKFNEIIDNYDLNSKKSFESFNDIQKYKILLDKYLTENPEPTI